jgi:hypothetical protein
MKLLRNSKVQIIIGLLLLLSLSILLFMWPDKEGRTSGDSPMRRGSSDQKGFTFFDLGPDTPYSPQLRSALAKRLGPDSIGGWNVLDLEINYSGFLAKFLPDLEALNRKLNYSGGLRTRKEHDVIELMYRNPQKKNLPFDDVRLVFSNLSKKPLVFRIRLKQDGAYVLEELRTGYGPPRMFDWKEDNPNRYIEKGESYVWSRGGDALAVSIIWDRIGNPACHVVYFFADNIRELIEREEQAAEKQGRNRASAAKSAF